MALTIYAAFLYHFQTIFPSLGIAASCQTRDPICFGELEDSIFCTVPEVRGTADITSLLAGLEDTVNFDVCFTQLVVAGIPLGALGLPLCVSAAAPLIEPLINGLIEGIEGIVGDRAPCSATVGGEACNSCSLCQEGGMVFDCSNIEPEVVSSSCTSSFPTSFDDVFHPENISPPELDGYRR